MPILPLFGRGVQGRSSNVTAQRRVNMYVEKGEPDKSSDAVLYPRPGLLRRYLKGTPTGSAVPGGPFRGIIHQDTATWGGVGELLYGVQAQRVCLGVTTDRWLSNQYDPPTVLSLVGPVQFGSLGLQTIFVDGITGYVAANGTTMSQEGVTTFPDGAKSICTIAQRFVVDDPSNAGRFRWSGVSDAFSWSSTDFATAESNPDPLSSVFSARGELLLFGSKSIEFWRPTGDSAVFAQVGGSGVDWGLAYFDTVRKLADNVMFVGRSNNAAGNPQVCLLNGYQVEPVSTPDIDYDIISEVARGANPVATPVTVGGHAWYVLNLKNTSYVYDITTRSWDEWRTDGARWAGQYATSFNKIGLVTDYRDGRVYELDQDTYTDDGTYITREVQTRHLYHDLDRLTVDEICLDIEVGVGVASGQGSDPQVMLQVSRDGGHTWGNEMWASIGPLGNYATRVSWMRLGRARDFVFRFKVSDPVKVVMIGASMRVR